jgi:glycosyl hydrolase family 113
VLIVNVSRLNRDPPVPSATAASTRIPSSPTPEPTTPPVSVLKPRANATDFQAGVTLVIYGDGAGFGSQAAPLLDRLAVVGANSLSIAFPFYQRSSTASTVEDLAGATPSPDHLAGLIRAARERHFTVMLRPLIDEQSLIAEGQWRGSLRPASVRQWFESYGSHLLPYAGLAQQEGVESICIGTELVSLEQEKQEWMNLIAKVRSVFRGQLTYCANWDSFSRASFWEGLDFVGIDGFFPLNAPSEASVDEMAAAWQPWARRLEQFQLSVGKPIVMTELGVTSQRGSHRQPWLWDQGTPVDLEGQGRYYRATCDALHGILGGMYWWAVDLVLPIGLVVDGGYSPLAKPAESEIQRCFA